MTQRVLTGVKPTGIPHLGNYFGTLRPAIAATNQADDSFMFIANYHALNQIQDAKTLEHNTLSIAATWLACGLDLNTTHLYAQSDIPEVFELSIMLTSFTPKGWMNKAHAYKAASDENAAANKPADDGINMGLYTYPVLMAADIILFDAGLVPVGKDQVQHVEIARDIAQKINHHYNAEVFVLPEHRIEENVGTVIGTDGRKMSKSYDNVIPLFASADERQKYINKIVTDSSEPSDEKQLEGTSFLSLLELVANDDERDEIRTALETGQMGWGDGKKRLGELMDREFSGMSAEYERLMSQPDEIRNILEEGARKIRPIAQETIARARAVMGVI